MGLTFAESASIARRSIKAVSGTNVEDIMLNDTIDRSGIPDSDGLRLAKRLACQSKEFGAPKFGHRLAFEDLASIENDSTVRDYADEIQANAEEDAS
jgi:hypothetical protein